MPNTDKSLPNIVAFEDLPVLPFAQSCITIGNFDGVHRGHQFIINELVHRGFVDDLPVVVITFFPNPSDFFRHSNQPYYLTTPEEKVALLKGLGVDEVITFRFDREFADLSAETFIAALKEKLGLKVLLVGYDFVMGKDRQGTIPVIRELGQQYDFELEELAPVELGGGEISSTRIRQALNEGDVRLAAEMLGRPYSVQGTVTYGSDRGSRIGLPTANIDHWHRKLLPSIGVYATHPVLNGKQYDGITNVGVRPTFETQERPNIETHILDFDGNIYGKKMELHFIEKIRDEQKFSGVDAFLAQIERDKATARRIFSHDET
jgi:riboflavin kinase/FMN adenylyltransferase